MASMLNDPGAHKDALWAVLRWCDVVAIARFSCTHKALDAVVRGLCAARAEYAQKLRDYLGVLEARPRCCNALLFYRHALRAGVAGVRGEFSLGLSPDDLSALRPYSGDPHIQRALEAGARCPERAWREIGTYCWCYCLSIAQKGEIRKRHRAWKTRTALQTRAAAEKLEALTSAPAP
jgi:hypothetical protein